MRDDDLRKQKEERKKKRTPTADGQDTCGNFQRTKLQEEVSTMTDGGFRKKKKSAQKRDVSSTDSDRGKL